MFGILKNMFAPAGNEQLKEAIKQGAFLVDVRTPAEFSAGSVKGAVNIPLDKILSQLASFKNKKHIVVFCRSGSRSSQAKSALERSGLQNIINGGAWQHIKQLVDT